MKIAIDGPAGAGKSTVAKAIAKKMNINYLDTGAMYRTVAYSLINKGIDVKDEKAVEAAMDTIDVKIKYENGVQHMFSGGEDVSDKIRTQEISMGASDVSKHPCIRLKLVKMQRDVADEYDVVMDGRDIGTYVLPDADYKFYVTASANIRAKRRYLELPDPKPSIEEIEKDIIKRDKNDMEREFAPLKQADDAILLDTSEMSIEEVTNYVLGIISNE